MTASTLPAAGGLDVNELSHKLATVTVQEEREWEGAELPEEGVANSDDASSTAAIFGSETGNFLVVSSNFDTSLK